VDYLPLAIAALIFLAGLREGRLALSGWLDHRKDEAATERQNRNFEMALNREHQRVEAVAGRQHHKTEAAADHKHRYDEADTGRRFQMDLLDTKQTNILEEIKARAEAEQNAADKWAQAGSAMRAGQDQDSDEPGDAVSMEIPLNDYRTP